MGKSGAETILRLRVLFQLGLQHAHLSMQFCRGIGWSRPFYVDV